MIFLSIFLDVQYFVRLKPSTETKSCNLGGEKFLGVVPNLTARWQWRFFFFFFLDIFFFFLFWPFRRAIEILYRVAECGEEDHARG